MGQQSVIDIEEASNSLTHFTLPEFARLILLLAQNSDVRQALLYSGRYRTREKMDQRIPRDVFWATVVAPAFNDVSISVAFVFTGILEDLRPGVIANVSRSGDDSKRQYNGVRSFFTQAYNKWTQSGQNDPNNFEDFCGRNALGKMCLVLFSVLKWNEKTEMDDLLLKFVLNILPPEAMADSGEYNDDSPSSKKENRKRKIDMADALQDPVLQLRDSMREQFQWREKACATGSRTELERQYTMLLNAKCGIEEGDEDERAFVTAQLEKVKKAMDNYEA